MTRLRTTALVTFAGLSGLAGCHSHEHAASTAVSEYFYDCEDPKRPPALKVFATDESLAELINKEAAGALSSKAGEVARLAMPATGATLSATTPPSFVIEPPVVGARAPGAPVPRVTPRRPFPERARRWLWQAISPIGTAHAHCMPVTGDNFLLRLSRAGDSSVAYAALASVTSFTPDGEVWKKAMQGRAGQTLTVTLLRAYYSGGTITNGPFVSSEPVSFTVGP